MGLIVVIVILAILAAILIPGLLKWIDQAKDKKYELEAREIALAAEAALAKCYVQGIEVQERAINGELVYSNMEYYNFMNIDETFAQEMEELIDAEVKIKSVELYGEKWGTDGQLRPWEGNVSGFWIWFISSDGEKIKASYVPIYESVWKIEKNPVGWSDESDYWKV